MYHCTDRNSAMNIDLGTGSMRPSDRGYLGYGVYASPDINKCAHYGEEVLVLLVDIGRTYEVVSDHEALLCSRARR